MAKRLESGVYATSELEKIYGNRMAVKRAFEAGEINKVIRGYYSTPDLSEPRNTFVMIAKFCPDAVVSNLSILQHYGLSQEYVDKVHLDVPNESGYREGNELIEFHRSRKMVGVTDISVNGVDLKGYSIHRALFEVIAVEANGAGNATREAVNAYVKSGEADINELRQFAELFGSRGEDIVERVRTVMAGRNVL
nr:hypothetical protein BdHM001_35010 [Bdellovibrio sp. HM001]